MGFMDKADAALKKREDRKKEKKAEGAKEIEDILLEALDLNKEQYEENKELIDDLIERGVTQLEESGTRANASNLFILANMIREEAELPEITPEDFVGGYESAAAEAGADPDAIEAESRALQELGNRITPEMTDAERAIVEINRRAQEQDLRGARQAALSSARGRGFGGAGQEFQAGLAAQQEGSERRMLQDLAASGMAIERSERALRDYGTLAGGIRERSFAEEFKTGTAADDATEFGKTLRFDYDQYKTKTLREENKDKWDRSRDITGAKFGYVADQYGYETAPLKFEAGLLGAKTGLGERGTAATVQGMQTLAGAKQAERAALALEVEEDEGLFGLGVFGL